MGFQIDGVDVTEIFIDGQPVTELQIDGVTVWTSVPAFVFDPSDWGALPKDLNSGYTDRRIDYIEFGDGVWVCTGDIGQASRSTDGGVTWETLPRGLTGDKQTVYGLGTDGNGNWAAAKLNGKVATSSDGGATWEDKSTGLGWATEEWFDVQYAGGVWLAVGDRGYNSYSTDLFETFTRGSKPPTNRFLCCVGDGHGKWMAGDANGDTFTTTDFIEWTELTKNNNGGGFNDCKAVATDGKGTWLAGFHGGYRCISTDNAVTWQPLPRQQYNSDINNIVTNGSGLWLMCCLNGWVDYSDDNGQTWTSMLRDLNAGDTAIHFMGIGFDGVNFFVVGERGYGSANPAPEVPEPPTSAMPLPETDSWSALLRDMNSGTTSRDVILVLHLGGSRWLFVIDLAYASITEDDGETFVRLSRGIDGSAQTINGGDKQGDTVMLCKNSSYLVRSGDAGVTWTELPRFAGLPETFGALYAVGGDGAGNWVVCAYSTFLGYSTDDGLTFSDTGVVLESRPVTVKHSNGVWMVGCQQGRLYRSTDMLVWTEIIQSMTGDGHTCQSLDTDGNGVWVAGFSSGYALRSTDNGLSFTEITQGLGHSGIYTTIHDLVSLGGGNWFATQQDGKASVSMDNGITWQDYGVPGLGSGYAGGDIYQIAHNGDPDNPIYMSGSESGYGALSVLPETSSVTFTFNLLVNTSSSAPDYVNLDQDDRVLADVGLLNRNGTGTFYLEPVYSAIYIGFLSVGDVVDSSLGLTRSGPLFLQAMPTGVFYLGFQSTSLYTDCYGYMKMEYSGGDLVFIESVINTTPNEAITIV